MYVRATCHSDRIAGTLSLEQTIACLSTPLLSCMCTVPTIYLYTTLEMERQATFEQQCTCTAFPLE